MDLIAIQELLLNHYSVNELKTRCFKLGINYEDLSGENRTDKARELVAYLDRRGELEKLKEIVLRERPKVVWPADIAPTSPSAPAIIDRWQLTSQDFDKLVALLAAQRELRTASGRIDFLDHVFAGSPRGQDILSLIDVDRNPRSFAVQLISRLTSFGQDTPGQESLGVLINKLLTYLGGGPDADFLRGLFDRYPLKTTPTATRPLDEWVGRDRPQDVQEKIIGENTLRHIHMLQLAWQASHAVVRVRTANNKGSGFLIAPNLIMTNNHVLKSTAQAASTEVDFNYQLTPNGQAAELFTTAAKADGAFYTQHNLDVTLFEIEATPATATPLTLSRQHVQRDDRLNIIQHPGGHYKKISMQNNFVAFADHKLLQYLTSTEPGSSGSPVFNNDFVVVGIHHSGGTLRDPIDDRPYLRNAGSSMIAILDDLQNNAPALYDQLTLQ